MQTAGWREHIQAFYNTDCYLLKLNIRFPMALQFRHIFNRNAKGKLILYKHNHSIYSSCLFLVFTYFMCLSVHYICTVPIRPEESMDPLELDLQRVVRHHVGAGNRYFAKAGSVLSCWVISLVHSTICKSLKLETEERSVGSAVLQRDTL